MATTDSNTDWVFSDAPLTYLARFCSSGFPVCQSMILSIHPFHLLVHARCGGFPHATPHAFSLLGSQQPSTLSMLPGPRAAHRYLDILAESSPAQPSGPPWAEHIQKVILLYRGRASGRRKTVRIRDNMVCADRVTPAAPVSIDGAPDLEGHCRH